MRVLKISSEAELQRCVEFAGTVYASNPYWVPPDMHHMVKLLGGHSAFAPQSEVQALAAEDDRGIAATVVAVRDDVYDRHWNEQMGHLLFFEALPDRQEAVAALMESACEWLRSRRVVSARLSMLPGWQLPMTIDAYDTVPTIFHTFNPPYYHSYVKNAGFRTEHGAVQYQLEFTPELAERYRGMVARASGAGVTIRDWDFGRLDEETEIFTELFNESFAAHWGFMALPADVMKTMTVELKDLLVPQLTAFADAGGHTVGAVYAIPDLNQAFHKMRGRSIEDNMEEFQRHLAAIDHGVLLIIGVRKSHRGRGVNLAMAAKSYLAMMDRGYRTGSYTAVMDDNWASRRTAEKLGARVTRNFIVYRKDL
jgi:hypothetical protein